MRLFALFLLLPLTLAAQSGNAGQSPKQHVRMQVDADHLSLPVSISIKGKDRAAVDARVDAIRKESGLNFDVADYREHAIGMGANAAAIAYVELRLADGSSLFGVGVDKNIVVASLKAVISGVNRALKKH